MKSDWEIIRELDLPDKRKREMVKAFNEMPTFFHCLDFKLKFVIAVVVIQNFKNKYGNDYL